VGSVEVGCADVGTVGVGPVDVGTVGVGPVDVPYPSDDGGTVDVGTVDAIISICLVSLGSSVGGVTYRSAVSWHDAVARYTCVGSPNSAWVVTSSNPSNVTLSVARLEEAATLMPTVCWLKEIVASKLVLLIIAGPFNAAESLLQTACVSHNSACPFKCCATYR